MKTWIQSAAFTAALIAGPALAQVPAYPAPQPAFPPHAGSPHAAPPGIVMHRPAPHGYAWQPGYWAWAGHRQVWVEGRWVHIAVPPPRHRWHHRHWNHHGWHGQPHGDPYRGYR